MQLEEKIEHSTNIGGMVYKYEQNIELTFWYNN